MTDLDVTIASAVRRSSTRHGFLAKALRLTVASTVAGGYVLSRPEPANAANCSYYGVSGAWGCECNLDRAACGGSICSNGNCAPNYKRCDYWTQANSQGQYCWCSNTCYNGSMLGYFTCCDCYTTSGSGCDRSATKCVCPQFHCTNC